MSRVRVASVASAVLVMSITLMPSTLRASESAPVIVSMGGAAELRVQVSEGLTKPCDSENNRLLFDGRLKPGESFRTTIASDCICVRHTSAAFRRVDWTMSGLACRRRICQGRICRPAPDPTIYVSLP